MADAYALANPAWLTVYSAALNAFAIIHSGTDSKESALKKSVLWAEGQANNFVASLKIAKKEIQKEKKILFEEYEALLFEKECGAEIDEYRFSFLKNEVSPFYEQFCCEKYGGVQYY